MRIKNIVILMVALFYLLTGSASAAVDFPADEAGISAYVKAKASIDLNLTKSAFASIERETPDYIIGTVSMWRHEEEEYPHVYVSKDGWIVAYYPKARSSGWIMPWQDYTGGPMTSTTLSKAVANVATVVGGTSTGLKYYDFRYPDASNMMIIFESTTGTNSFKVTIPTTFSMFAVDWSHYSATVGCGYGCGPYSRAYLDGSATPFSNLGVDSISYGSMLGLFANGIEHEVKIVAYSGTGRIGLVLEYAE
jgi:hypothetical protein